MLSAFFISSLFTFALATAETVTVRHVLDGDSIILMDGRQVRLIGINAPDFGKNGAPDQPLARAAQQRLAGLVTGRSLTLDLEVEPQDHYGRLLAHVTLSDGTNVEELLLHEGLAWMVAIPPNVGHLERLQRAEHEARRARRGVWREPSYLPKPAHTLTRRDTGFQIIEGKIIGTGQSRHMIYFDLAPKVAVAIPREAWKKHFAGSPSAWVGRQVIARGWLTESRGRRHLRVAHPAMLTWPG